MQTTRWQGGSSPNGLDRDRGVALLDLWSSRRMSRLEPRQSIHGETR